MARLLSSTCQWALPVVAPADSDFADLDVSGFARAALQDLRGRVEAGGEGAEEARDALALLTRLAGGGR